MMDGWIIAVSLINSLCIIALAIVVIGEVSDNYKARRTNIWTESKKISKKEKKDGN